jgi:peptidyl-prolyl cis-trans isomerase A (cyclophilin A)
MTTFATLLLAATLQAAAPAPVTPDSLVHVVLETELGEIEVALNATKAPITTTNFLRYVDAGLYEGGTFYRTVGMDNQPNDSVKIEVIQGGVDRSRRREGFDPIPMEGTGTTGLRHLDGTISMARGGPDSARGEFFICVGPQPSLDEGGNRNLDGFGFAAFGQVVRGMDVVRRIHVRADNRQTLVEPVGITGARRVEER